MSPTARRGLLGVSLLITLITAWFAPPIKDEGVALSERTHNTGAFAGDTTQLAMTQANSAVVHTETSSRIEVLSIRPRVQEIADDDRHTRLFASAQSPQPPKKISLPQTESMAITSAPPQAPPLPFHVLGRYDVAGQAVIFLQHNDQNLVVRVGDTLAGEYKVESLNGTTLTLRYLPLNQPQNLEINGMQYEKE